MAPQVGTLLREGFVVLSRKKHVPATVRPNTYRVISTVAEDAFGERPHMGPRLWEGPGNTNIIGQRELGWSLPHDKGHFRRQTIQYKFRMENAGNAQETLMWLQPKQASKDAADSAGPQRLPPGTWDVRDSTTRETYRAGWRPGMNKCSRFSAYSYPSSARGVVPVTNLREPNGKVRFWREDISFNNLYDSRRNPNYPMPGKKHGAFTWEKLNYDDVVKQPVSSKPYIYR